MLTFIMSVVFSITTQVATISPSCETYRPNLEGLTLTVCDGTVTSRCDNSGYCQIAE